MTTDLSSLYVRPATPEDHAEVVSIRDDVADGADYLGDYYRLLMHNRKAYCYVLVEKSGRIVSVMSIFHLQIHIIPNMAVWLVCVIRSTSEGKADSLSGCLFQDRFR